MPEPGAWPDRDGKPARRAMMRGILPVADCAGPGAERDLSDAIFVTQLRESSRATTARRCDGLVPQQPPTPAAPAESQLSAWSAKVSGSASSVAPRFV